MQTSAACGALRQGVPRGAASTPGLPGGSPKGGELKATPVAPGGRAYGKCNLRLHVARLRGPGPCGKGFPGVRRAPRPAGRLPERWELKGNAWAPGGRAYGKCNLRLHVASGASALRQGGSQGCGEHPWPAGRLPGKVGTKGQRPWPRRARLRKMQPRLHVKISRGPSGLAPRKGGN